MFELGWLTCSDVDLTSLISTADTTASDVVEHQRDALEQRKDLAQKTRDFRKLDDAGKLSEYKGLLKGMVATCELALTDH
jgi:homeobox protein cut-like